MFTSFCSKLFQATAYQILSESPEFCRRFCKKKHFGLFFPKKLYTCDVFAVVRLIDVKNVFLRFLFLSRFLRF